MTQPDPDPYDTPGLGDLIPGDTPPAESSISGLSFQEPPPGRVITPMAITITIVLALVIAAYFVSRAVALW
jgi:hypothetical protein